MSLEQGNETHNRQVVDKYVNPNADYAITVRDYVIRPSADAISGAITLTLPPVAEAKGRFYSIIPRDADGTNTITVEDNNDDSEMWLADIVMNNAGDRLLCYSDGLAWMPAFTGSFPGLSTDIPAGTTSLAPTTTATTAAPTTAP